MRKPLDELGDRSWSAWLRAAVAELVEAPPLDELGDRTAGLGLTGTGRSIVHYSAFKAVDVRPVHLSVPGVAGRIPILRPSALLSSGQSPLEMVLYTTS